MANTTAVAGTSVEITGLDADWVWSTDLPVGLRGKRTRSIQFIGSAANDRLIARDGGIDAAAAFDSGPISGATDVRVKYFDPPKGVNWVIDISDCTLNTAANCKVLIDLVK